MSAQQSTLIELFLTFAKIGAMTFGGGYAMIPMIQAEIVAKKGWITEVQLMDFFALSQMTPGVLAVNLASFIGYKRHGAGGAVMATAGVAGPSLIIICIIAAFFKAFMDNPLVVQVFAALRIGVCALIIIALIPFFKTGIKNIFTAILFVLSALIFGFLSPSPIYLILACAGAGIAAAKFNGGLK